MSEKHYRREFPELNDKEKLLHLIFQEGCYTAARLGAKLHCSRYMATEVCTEFGITASDFRKARFLQTRTLQPKLRKR